MGDFVVSPASTRQGAQQFEQTGRALQSATSQFTGSARARVGGVDSFSNAVGRVYNSMFNGVKECLPTVHKAYLGDSHELSEAAEDYDFIEEHNVKLADSITRSL